MRFASEKLTPVIWALLVILACHVARELPHFVIGGFSGVERFAERSRGLWEIDLSDTPPGTYFLSVGKTYGGCDILLGANVLATNRLPSRNIQTSIMLGVPFVWSGNHNAQHGITILCDPEKHLGPILDDIPLLAPYSIGVFLHLVRTINSVILLVVLAAIFFLVILFPLGYDTLRRNEGQKRTTILWLPWPFYLFGTAVFAHSVSLAYIPTLFLTTDSFGWLHITLRIFLSLSSVVLFGVYSRIRWWLVCVHIVLFGAEWLFPWIGAVSQRDFYHGIYWLFPISTALVTWDLFRVDRRDSVMQVFRGIGVGWCLLQAIDAIVLRKSTVATFFTTAYPGIFVGFLIFAIYMERRKRESEGFSLMEKIGRVEKENALLGQEAMLAEIAAQVAHDIRSPLSALEVSVDAIRLLPSDYQRLLLAAIGRIKDIANELLDTRRSFLNDSGAVLQGLASEEIVFTSIDEIVTEKRAQYRDLLNISIDVEYDMDAYSLFSRMDRNSLKRIVSNLINNSVEAMGGIGLVLVRLEKQGEFARLSVTDNGPGISSAHVGALGNKSATFGKGDGSGLGLYHARNTIESLGGSIQIGSELGQGTTVEMQIPLCECPRWFISEIEVEAGTTVVVFDDDRTICRVWEQKFSPLMKDNRVTVLHFVDQEGFLVWWTALRPQKVLFLVDYDLSEDKKGGFPLENVELARSTILVTNYHDELTVREKCLEMGIKLMPKSMVWMVPVKLG